MYYLTMDEDEKVKTLAIHKANTENLRTSENPCFCSASSGKTKPLDTLFPNSQLGWERDRRGREASSLTLPQGRGTCSAPYSICPGTAAFYARVVRTEASSHSSGEGFAESI